MTYKQDLNIKIASIDWSEFDKYSMNTIDCFCEAIYKSHCKGINIDRDYIVITREPCPSCGSQYNVKRAQSEPELWVL